MAWPLSQDYNEAVQNPVSAFSDPELRRSEPSVNALGLPIPRSGNFADVYQLRSTHSSRRWAVKCFTREVPGLRDRYREISIYLRQVDLPFMVDFNYLDQGIRIHGRWYPVLKMHWIEGLPLNEFVKAAAVAPQLLETLAQIWMRLARKLRDAHIAHCDLQHGNILLVPGSKANSLGVKLIDYDGMCVPALAQRQSGEVGHPAFQHPQRIRQGTYGFEVDRFPHLVIYCALRALIAGGRALWERFDNGDNLLFRQQDLEAPNKSPLFCALLELNDPVVHTLADRLSRAVHEPLERTSLLEDLVPDGQAAAPAAISPKCVQAQTAPEAVPVLTPEMIFAAATTGDESTVGRRYYRRRRRRRRSLAWIAAGVVLGGIATACTIMFLGNRTKNEASGKDAMVARKDVPHASPAASRSTSSGGNHKAQNGLDLHPDNVNVSGQPLAALDGPNPAKFGTSTLPSKLVLTKMRWIGGALGQGGFARFDDSQLGNVVVGFDLYFDQDEQGKPQFLTGIAPIYSKSTSIHQPVRGRRSHRRTRVRAPKGYAVAGMSAEADVKIYGFKILFWKVMPRGLVAQNPVSSPWLGGHGGKRMVLAEDGRPVVGIYGTAGPALERLGLIQRDRKFLVPDQAALKEAAQRFANLLKDELARTTRAEWRAYGANLLQQALKRGHDPVGRYFLLQRAHYWVIRSGDYSLALKVIEHMAKEYDINPRPLICEALGLALLIIEEEGKTRDVTAKHRELLDTTVPLLEEALVLHDLDATSRLTQVALGAAQECHDRAMVVYAARLSHELADMRQGRKTGPDLAESNPPSPKPPESTPIVEKQPSEKRHPVPTTADLDKAIASIHARYKTSFDKRKRTVRLALAGKLLDEGLQSTDDLPMRFALLREARDVAAGTVAPALALEAADELANSFAVNALAMKAAAMTLAGRAASNRADHRLVAETALAVVKEATAVDDFEAADKLLTVARTAVDRSNSSFLRDTLRQCTKQIESLRNEYDRVKPAAQTLAAKPKDPTANLAVGKYECFFKGDWDKGLPMLALGSDPKLKELARKDQDPPIDAEGQVMLGDEFWALAGQESGLSRRQLMCRACYWYEQAAPNLDGPTKTQVAKKIAEFDKKFPEQRLTILVARYGADSTWVDVTRRVQYLWAQANSLSLRFKPTDLHIGDPAPGKYKSLVIVYRYHETIYLGLTGQQATATIKTVTARRNPERQKVRSGQRLTILHAKYGADNTWVDVTAKVRELAKDSSLVMKPADLRIPDPVFGKHKALVIVFKYCGRVYLNTTGQSQPVVIQPILGNVR